MHHFRWDANTNEDERGEQLADETDTADYTILDENEAMLLPTNGRSTLSDIIGPPMTSHCYQTGQSPSHWPAISCPSSSPSTQNCP